MVQYLSNPLISNTTLNIPYPYAKKDAEHWLKMNHFDPAKKLPHTFVLEWKRTKKMIGAMGLHPTDEHNRAEIGYWVAVPYWNKGVATEALNAVMEYGFYQHGYHKLLATHMMDNMASGRVMIKAGMKKEGKLKDHYKKNGRYKSILMYALTRADFDKMKKPKLSE